jgi:hypothetical protein
MKIMTRMIAVALVIAGIPLACACAETVSMKADKPTAMTIELKAGKKIVSHPSGVVVEYTKEDMERRLDELLVQKKAIEEEIKRANDEMVEIERK